MTPGFYDAHSHFTGVGCSALFIVDLNSPPIGAIESISDIIAMLGEKASTTAEGEWLLGFGYDDTLIAEGRHPTRDDLDKISTTHPTLIAHVSGHLSVANSLTLELAGIDESTPTAWWCDPHRC